MLPMFLLWSLKASAPKKLIPILCTFSPPYVMTLFKNMYESLMFSLVPVNWPIKFSKFKAMLNSIGSVWRLYNKLRIFRVLPKLFVETSASKKLQVKCWPASLSFIAGSPQHRMGDPLSPTRPCPVAGSEEWCGRMLKAAPVSTRKLRPVNWSLM